MSAPSVAAWQFQVVDSLEKVFADTEPRPMNPSIGYSVFLGEPASFQVAFRAPADADPNDLALTVELDPVSRPHVTIRAVDLVPCAVAAQEGHDEHYLRTKAGFYPDLLRPLDGGAVLATRGEWRALWFDLLVEDPAAADVWPITVTVRRADDGRPLFEETIAIDVLPRTLPELDIVNCHWLHADCLANYYGVRPFSEAHWRYVESFIAKAAQLRCNGVLTPVWTPPLDTGVDTYRTPVQLVDVEIIDGRYHFEFSKLGRWLDICRRHAIRYIEISHLFSQWGAVKAPAVYARVDDRHERIFGWQTSATDPEYTRFLHELIPQLNAFLAENWAVDRVLYHISDEPHGPEQRATYRQARASVLDLLGGCQVVDALSDFEFYTTGLVPVPIVANDAVEPFLEAGADPLWVYYCVAQRKDVANRFIALPSSRNRVLGHQLFAFNVQGFLHWGFNFYNAVLSTHAIDPFEDTTSAGAFPAGDPFIVYPGPDGEPLESIRFRVFTQAMDDLRAMRRLAQLRGRAAVMEIIDPDGALRFNSFSYDPDFYRQARERINRAIMSTR